MLETALPTLAVGAPAQVSVAGMDAPVVGRVRLVPPRVDDRTRLGAVRIALGLDPALRVGAFARATITTAVREGVVVPATAVLDDADASRVLVVEDGVVHDRTVETGLRQDDAVEITAGLAPGEVVLARAGAFFRDGDAVRPVEATEPPAPAVIPATTGRAAEARATAGAAATTTAPSPEGAAAPTPAEAVAAGDGAPAQGGDAAAGGDGSAP